MYDNMNNYTATFDGCSIKTEEIENLGQHTFLSADSGAKRVILESEDVGGIGSFIGDDNKFFIIKYMGKMPKITYQYHFNDTELDTIFEVDPSGDNFGKLTFSPNDDVSAGAAQTSLNLTSFDNYSENIMNGRDNSVISSTLAVHSYVGTTSFDGHENGDYIGIAVYSRGVRVPILKTLGTGLILGEISKRIVISLSDTTRLESFSVGEIKMFDATRSNEESLSTQVLLSEMIDDLSYSLYHENIRKFQKMLNHPNKMFDVDSQL